MADDVATHSPSLIPCWHAPFPFPFPFPFPRSRLAFLSLALALFQCYKKRRQWGGKRTSTKSSATRHRMEGLVETASDVPLDIEDPSLLSELVWDTAAELPGQ